MRGVLLLTPLRRSKKKGSPIEWINLEPVVVKVDGIMLGFRAPNSNVGKLFIDFILSEEGRDYFKVFNAQPSALE